jgi:hypothetical protein
MWHKVALLVTIDGRPVESSSVMEVTYSKVTQSLIGNGGTTHLYGQALIFDFAGKGTIFILPIRRPPTGSIIYNIYEFKVLRTFGVKNSVGSLSPEASSRCGPPKDVDAITLTIASYPPLSRSPTKGTPKRFTRSIRQTLRHTFPVLFSKGLILKLPMSP